MKRKVLVDKSKAPHEIAMILIMVVLLVGCNSGSNQSQTTTNSPNTQGSTLPLYQPPNQPGQGATSNAPSITPPQPQGTLDNILNPPGGTSKPACPHACLLIPPGRTADEIISIFEKENNCSIQGSTNLNKNFHPNMTLSLKAINLLKNIEMLKLKPYDDQTGKAINKWVQGATIGYGHLIKKNDWNLYKKGISNTQADQIFNNDLAPFVKAVNDAIKLQISQQQFDALVILSYNIGVSAFASSSVAKLVNNPNAKTPYSSLEDAWKSWNKSQGKINQGLINRRNSEWNIYTKGIYKKW
jgi:GH24 family phage-related lysozyme (muramidase)